MVCLVTHIIFHHWVALSWPRVIYRETWIQHLTCFLKKKFKCTTLSLKKITEWKEFQCTFSVKFYISLYTFFDSVIPIFVSCFPALFFLHSEHQILSLNFMGAHIPLFSHSCKLHFTPAGRFLSIPMWTQLSSIYSSVLSLSPSSKQQGTLSSLSLTILFCGI